VVKSSENSSAGAIAGDYLQANAKLVLKPPADSPYKIVGTPPEIDGQHFPYNNQVFTAFLKKNCEYNSANPTDLPNTPPWW
jgi:hypothetical protein